MTEPPFVHPTITQLGLVLLTCRCGIVTRLALKGHGLPNDGVSYCRHCQTLVLLRQATKENS